MRGFLACLLSIVLSIGLMPSLAIAEGEAHYAPSSSLPLTVAPADGLSIMRSQAMPSVPEANPEAVTGATAPADEASREKVYVEDYYDRDYSDYYGPADGVLTDDGTVIEAALADASGKTLVLEPDKTYTFGSYIYSNAWENLWRDQGIHLRVSDVVIEGNGATIRWDDNQAFVGGNGLVLEGTMESPLHDIVIRNLNFYSANCSRDFTDPITGKTFKNGNLVQLKGMSCKNVLVENCTFTAVPNPDEALHRRSDEEGRGVTNIWFYGGAQDITVRGCEFRDVTCGSQESGSNLLFSGECEWLRRSTGEFQTAYAAMSTEEQYRTICDQHLQGTVENILVEDNAFEHACHDESVSLWCGEVFKDILIRKNTFNVHDNDAHVPSTVNFTFGLPAHHDRFENFIFTDNDVYGEASWALLASRADMGGDMHFTNNNLHFKRIKLFRQRVLTDNGYVISPKNDIATTNGLMYAAYNRDYVDFSDNCVTYDNDDGKGLMNLMGAKNVLCTRNDFIANGPLSYLAVIFASEAEDAAGHETVFFNNSFDINGTLDKSLLRGSFTFIDNVVRLNGNVAGANELFAVRGNIDSSTTPKTNRLYVLHDDVDITGNKIFAKTALKKGLAGLSVYDASFAGHSLNFTGNSLWSTVGQEGGDWPLVSVQDVQGETPVVNATGTLSNLFNMLTFYRTRENEDSYTNYQGTLTDPKVLQGSREFTGGSEGGRTRHPLGIEEYTADVDESGSAEGGGSGTHAWAEPTYTWSDDCTSCTARRMCSNASGHVEEETVEATSEMTRAATCTQRGETTYTAEFSKDCFAKQTATVDDRAVNPDAHAWGAWTQTKTPTCSSAGEQRRICSNDGSHVETREVAMDPDAHAWGEGSVTIEPTCTTPGVRTYTCASCNATRTEVIRALGHEWGEWIVKRLATEKEDGLEERACSRCSATQDRAIPATGRHSDHGGSVGADSTHSPSSDAEGESGSTAPSDGDIPSDYGSGKGNSDRPSGSSTNKAAEDIVMHRLYNPYSGEHFFTSSEQERDDVVAVGWTYEGAGWTAPASSSTPVFRLYNAYGGEHHYTMSTSELSTLIEAGWIDEGTGWYSNEAQADPLFRVYNPNAFANNHHYTTSASERDLLLGIGWKDEGIGWYGM